MCASCAAGRHWRDRRGAAASCDVHPSEWRQLCNEVRDQHLSRLGIDVGEVSLVLHVQERAGTVLLADGSDHPRWSETLTSVPAQLVLSPRP